ncbi:hypothetical protein FRC02_008225 [Tulasnella sp. 418]|nr:hypothetical protein FRC02_008225 [Tulasnella sp. 418]
MQSATKPSSPAVSIKMDIVEDVEKTVKEPLDTVSPIPPQNGSPATESAKIEAEDSLPTNTVASLDHSNESGPSRLAQYSAFWDAYNEEADREDKELVEGFGEDLNNLLIFAGLFSAINTAFIIESYRDLKEDTSETTNNLLRTLILRAGQGSSNEPILQLTNFKITPRAIRVNVFFFTSLACSLFAAFGAVIGKQWLSTYKREGHLKSKSGRGIERQKKYMGLERWKFQAVVETLPTLLQFSLFFFFIGLVDFLLPMNKIVVSIVAIFSLLCLLFWVATTVIGAVFPDSPFQTRLTAVLRRHLISSDPNPLESRGDDHILEGRCVDWLKQRTTVPNTIGMVAKAVVMLPESTKKEIGIKSPGVMIAYILQTTLTDGRVYLGISLEGLQQSLPVLCDLVMKWDRREDPIYPGDEAANDSFLRVFAAKVWSTLFSPESLDGALSSAAIEIILCLDSTDHSDPRPLEYLIGSLRSEGVSAEYQLNRLLLLHRALKSFPQPFSRIDTSAAHHLPSLLVTTMWGSDGRPDLHPQRVDLRLTWLLHDFESFYPHLVESSFSRYLSEWQATVRDASRTPAQSTAASLYLQTILRLLVREHEEETLALPTISFPPYSWSRRLERGGHIAHLIDIAKTEELSEMHLLCLLCFLFVTDVVKGNFDTNSPFTYYKLEWVELVLMMLNQKSIDQLLLHTEAFPRSFWTRMTVILFEYLINAKRRKLLEGGKVHEVFSIFHNLGERLDLKDLIRTRKGLWKDVVGVSWIEESEWKLVHRGVPPEVAVPRSSDEPQQPHQFPETADIIELIEKIAQKAETSSCNCQKLLRIVSRAHDICEAIQEELVEFKAGNSGSDSHTERITALHEILSTVDDAVSSESSGVNLSSITLWEPNRSVLVDAFRTMYSSPFDMIFPEDLTIALRYSVQSDDLTWLSTVNISIEAHEFNNQYWRKSVVQSIAGMRTTLGSSALVSEDDNEASRILAIRCAMRVWFMLEALTDNKIFVESGIRELVIQDDLWEKANTILTELCGHIQGISNSTGTLEGIHERWDKFEKSLLIGHIPAMTTALKCDPIFEKKALTSKPGFQASSGTSFDSSHGMPFAMISAGYIIYRHYNDEGEFIRIRLLEGTQAENEEDLLVVPPTSGISHARGMVVSPDMKWVAYSVCDSSTGPLMQTAGVALTDPLAVKPGEITRYTTHSNGYLENIFWLSERTVLVLQNTSVYRLSVGDQGLLSESELLFNLQGNARLTQHGFFPSTLDEEWAAINISYNYEPHVQYWSKKDNNSRIVPGIGALARVSSGGVSQILLVTIQNRNDEGRIPIIVYQLDHRPFNRPSVLLSAIVSTESTSGSPAFIHVFEDLGVVFVVMSNYSEARGLLFDMHTGQKLQELPHNPAFMGMFSRDHPKAGKGVLLALDSGFTAYRLTLVKEEVGRLRHEWSAR